MIFDSKIIIVLMIIFFNMLYFFNQKNRIIAFFNVIISIFLLISLISLVATNQIFFTNFSLLLLIFLMICVFVIAIQNKMVKIKKAVKKNTFSFGYFLLTAIAVLGIYLAVSFLLTIKSNDSDASSNIAIIEKIDVNNSQLAQENYASKTSLFDEKDLAIKLFKGLSDIIIIICCFIPLLTAILADKYKIKNNESI